MIFIRKFWKFSDRNSNSSSRDGFNLERIVIVRGEAEVPYLIKALVTHNWPNELTQKLPQNAQIPRDTRPHPGQRLHFRVRAQIFAQSMAKCRN